MGITTFKKTKQYVNTLRYLKPSQIFWRIWRKVTKPKIQSHYHYTPSFPSMKWHSTILMPATMTSEDTFKFLNVEKKFSHWQGDTSSTLWLYNLHYFDDLNRQNALHRLTWHSALIQDWINKNPPGSKIAWDPYPLSLRIVNWIKWILKNKIEDRIILDSLYQQYHYLSQSIEYHLRGNHLFANIKALLFAEAFFNLPYDKSLSLLHEQLNEQINSDGAHFELSPMYHAIVLEDLLDIVNLFNLYQINLPNNFEKKITQMLAWLENMTHPDGEIAFFNDSAFGIAPKFSQLTEYANKLLPKLKFDSLINKPTNCGLIHIKTTNYDLIFDGANIGPDYLPGHAHADSLSFELSIGKQRVFVNSGTSCYEESPQRTVERQTSSHNTLTVDQQNSSDVWKSFRVAKRAKIINFDKKNDYIIAAHNGYKHLSGHPIHQRRIEYTEHRIIIIDEVYGQNYHQLDLYFHLHPAIEIFEGILLFWQQQPIAKMKFDHSLDINTMNSFFYPQFGMKTANKTIHLTKNSHLPVIIKTEIELTT